MDLWPFLYANSGVSWPRGYLTQGVEATLPLAPKPVYSGGITLSKDAITAADDNFTSVLGHEDEALNMVKKPKVKAKSENAEREKIHREEKFDEDDSETIVDSDDDHPNDVEKEKNTDKDDATKGTHPAKTPDSAPGDEEDGMIIDRRGKMEEAALSLPLMNSLPFFLQQPSAFGLAQLQQAMRSGSRGGMEFFPPWPPAAALFFGDYRRMGRSPYGKKYYNCPQCRYMTDRKNNLKRHVSTMHQECDKLLDCCGLMFKNKASLRDHVLIFHRNGYMCRFCGRNFCRKALLKRHLTVHSGQKDYVCSICDYATSHKSNLERHRKVHERQLHEAPDDSLPVLAFNPAETPCMGSLGKSDGHEGLTASFSLHTNSSETLLK